MESCEPFSQSFTNSTHMMEPRNSASNLMNHSGKSSSPQSINKQSETNVEIPEGIIGRLDVFIHQAHNIHNICIYHKQDVYAKLSLTGNPEIAVESKVIRSAGGNPVFNEKLQLSVQNIESSLRCEIWMRSGAPSHLEDQLLGFVLVPLADVIVAKGELEKEFALSANDLFHSAAGFVQLSIWYVGSYPDVMAVAAPPAAAVFTDTALPDSENEDSITSKFAKIEFVDWKVMNENNQMVSELLGVPCTEMDSQTTENLINSENGECHTNEEAGIRFVEIFSAENSIITVSGNDTPLSCVSVNGSPAISDQNPKEKESETDDTIMQPLIHVSVEPEQSVMPNDIVDLYMKAMQESLASMKLPMDIENNNNDNDDDNNNNNSKESGNSSTTEQKIPASMRTGTRVFYGSRAFF